MAKEFKLTKERLGQLEEELNYLKTTRELEVAELLKVARSFGDLSENSEYDEAKNEQSKLYGRIAEVENILAHAVLIEDADIEHDVVGLGSSVELEDLEFGDVDKYEIIGSQEANPAVGRISDDSPIGRAIHSVGLNPMAARIAGINVKLTKAQATKVAGMAHDGLARCIRPIHTSLDGDTIFCLSTGELEFPENPVDTVGILAARVAEQAIIRAVKAAK